MAYKIEPLDEEEYETLCWLSDHGYDAGICDHVNGPGEETTLMEPQAWEILEAIDEDPNAFLSSNGSRSLAQKLYKFIDDVV